MTSGLSVASGFAPDDVPFVNSHSSPVNSHSTLPPTPSLNSGPNSWRLPFVYFDITSSLLALISNLLIVVAVTRTKFALAGYRRFLLSLAAADIFMASTTVLTFWHEKLAESYSLGTFQTCANNILRSLTLVGYFASLLSIGGLTADNFLGIFRPLSYNVIMGGSLLIRLILTIWLVSIILGFIDFPITFFVYLNHLRGKQADVTRASPLPSPFFPLTKPQKVAEISPNQNDGDFSSILLSNETSTDELSFDLHGLIQDVMELIEDEKESTNYCTFYAAKKFGVELFVIGLTVPCFLLLLVIYGRIFLEVIRRRTSRQRKTFRLVLTTLLLIGSFTFCWMPFIIFEVVMYIRASSGHVDGDSQAKPSTSGDKQALLLNTIFNSLLMLSPLLNPLIYSTRIRRVRVQVLAILSCKKFTDYSTKQNGGERCDGANPNAATLARMRSINTSNFDTTSSRKHHSSIMLTKSNNSSLWPSSATSPPTTPLRFTSLLSPSSSFLTQPNQKEPLRSSLSVIGKMTPSGSFSNGSAIFNGCAAIANLKPDFRCNVRGCDALFLSQAAFYRHLTSKHSEDIKTCPCCSEIYYRERNHVCTSDVADNSSFLTVNQNMAMRQASLPVKPLPAEAFRNTGKILRAGEIDQKRSGLTNLLTLPTPLSSQSRSRSFLVEDRKVSEDELRELRKHSTTRRLSCGAVERRKRNRAKKERKRRRRRLTITGVVLTSLAEEDVNGAAESDDDDDEDCNNNIFSNNSVTLAVPPTVARKIDTSA